MAGVPRPLTVAATALLLLAGGCASGTDGSGRAELSNGSPPQAEVVPTPTSAAQELGLAAGWGPSAAQLERAATLAGEMSDAELAGQVIVASYAGTRAPVEMVRRLGLGGVIAFSDNVTSARQIRGVNRRLRTAHDREWPLLLGVDQEGGVVERVKQGTTRFPAFMTAGATREPALVRTAHRALGRELRGLGFTADFAPVADVTIGAQDPTIGSRSPAGFPGAAGEAAVAAAQGLDAAGVVPVLKHFPGHGSVKQDSHVVLPRQQRSLEQLRTNDLVPYQRAVAAGLPAVMVGHLDVRAVDPGVPSSLSRPVIEGLLREELGFAGLVVTDSLLMRAATDQGGSGRVAVRALRAGADVVLMPADPAAARDGIIRAVRRGDLGRDRLRQAAARQIALLLHGEDREVAPGAPGSAGRAARAYSAAAITSVSGPCKGRLVGRGVVPYGSADNVAAFTAAARRAGLPVVPAHAPPRQRRRASTLALVGYGGAPARADVVVSTDLPVVLGRSRARTRIATYGSTPAAMDALVQVLLGRAAAPGWLPLKVPGVPRKGC